MFLYANKSYIIICRIQGVPPPTLTEFWFLLGHFRFSLTTWSSPEVPLLPLDIQFLGYFLTIRKNQSAVQAHILKQKEAERQEYIGCLVQYCRISIANALDILQFCTEPSISSILLNVRWILMWKSSELKTTAVQSVFWFVLNFYHRLHPITIFCTFQELS